MSRPTTRSKNKRTRPCSDNDSSSELLRKIHVTGEITEDDVRQLYLIWKPICQSCRVNLKDSPNCFCGLAPPPNGSRKYGLWQRTSEIIQSLGPDPCKDCRSMDSPAGLTNLGATCYANSILQCLYMNRPFREGIFSVEMNLLKQHAVVDQLFRLFAHLHYSKMAFIDSAPFIKTLELDNGVQQDSHEFFTLFLSLLERSLSHSKVPHARTIVQDLFRGSVSHVTQCSVCGKESEASSKMEDFYELELNIKGLNNLDQSLEDYLSVEKLQGENQYFCESCSKRVDATRFIKLQKLPAVLNFQLKRCVFLPKTTTKKKITTVFSFPRRLHISLRLHDTPELQSELTYDLQAILIHRGTAVNSGHYVAHIKDKSSGQWWEFDDEHVSKLGLHPFGAEVSTSAQPERSYQTSSEQAHYFGNGNHVTNFHSLSPDLNITSFGDMFSSTDAYMLMYNRITTDEDVEKFSRRNSLPSHLLEEINEQNASYTRVCQEYQQRKDREINNIMERRQEVRSVLSEAPVLSVEDPFYWISADWLRQWADSTKPPPIDNAPIQCSHGKAPASKVGYMKRVSTKAWNSLYAKYGGGPVLSSGDCCTLCLKDEAENTVVTDTYRDRRAGMRQLAEAALAGQSFDGNQYYLSKTWLLQWLRRKNFDSPCDANSGPTASIQCPHGRLLPEQASGAKRLLVPEDLWYFIFECATAAKPDDPSGCLTFPSDSEACTLCSMEMTEVACLEDNLRAAKLKQRQNHEKLSHGKPTALYPGCKYYLLPSLWLSKWRIYVTSSGKNASSSAKPEGLEGAVDSIKCVKHSRLLERPLDLTCKRGGVIVQRASATDGLTLITESDWKLFCEEWEVPDVKAIVAEIDIEDCKLNKLDGSHEEPPSSEAPFNPSGDGLNSELECKPIIRTIPEVCEDCIGERESQQLMQKLNYQNEDIRVFFVHGKEVPRSVLEASGTIFESDRRTSKRSRRNSTSSSIDLKVSGSTSIYQLKMMIWESFGVVKENQKLHKGLREIDADESATLADRNIFPGDVLWVTDTEIYENRDIADELSGQKESWQTEEGFRGTLLTSDALCQGVKGAST